MIGPECAPSAQKNQMRRASQGLPPCGRLKDLSCRFAEDISHAADLIEERRRLFGMRPADELIVASLIARIHEIGTRVVSDGIEAEIANRKARRFSTRTDGLLRRDGRWA